MPGLIEGGSTRAGTAGGVLVIILANISSGDLLRTAVLAAFGAIVSFLVSLVLKRLLQWFRKGGCGRR